MRTGENIKHLIFGAFARSPFVILPNTQKGNGGIGKLSLYPDMGIIYLCMCFKPGISNFMPIGKLSLFWTCTTSRGISCDFRPLRFCRKFRYSTVKCLRFSSPFRLWAFLIFGTIQISPIPTRSNYKSPYKNQFLVLPIALRFCGVSVNQMSVLWLSLQPIETNSHKLLAI